MRWCLLIVVLFTLVAKANVKVTFLKTEGYRAEISLSGPVQWKEIIGYRQQERVTLIPIGNYEISVRFTTPSTDTMITSVLHLNKDTLVKLDALIDLSVLLQEVEITSTSGSVLDHGHLRQVEGMAIYAGKKSEVVNLSKSKANLATNNGRQVFAKVAGLNIWESDAGGIQLGIGGRGLSPNRTSNFNTRQNGYDISADALGYPESYYSPVPDMVERIEVVRGASSLQYGTQFGGLVNFKMKRANPDYILHGSCKATVGSFEFFNITPQLSFGTTKAGLYAAYQYKSGNSFREYSHFTNHTVFLSGYYNVKRRFSLGYDITKMTYLTQQPGGLTDDLFAKSLDTVLRKRNWFSVDWNLASVYMDFRIDENKTINTRFFGLLSNRKNVGYLGQINRPDLNQPRELIEGVFRNIGNETRYLMHYKWFKHTHTVLTGFRLYKGKTTAKQGLARLADGADFTFLNPNDIDYSNYLFPSQNASLFAENIFRIGKKMTLTPGARLEYISTKSQGYYYQRSFDLSGDTLLELKRNTSREDSRKLILGGLGLSYKPIKQVELFANASMNYRAINFSDIAIVNPNFKVDSLIQDETGYTIDGGARGSIRNWFSYDVSAFYLAYNNRIGEIFKVDEFSYNIIRYRTNIGNSYNYGLETFVEIDPIKLVNDSSKWSLSLFCNYAFIQAYYSENKEYTVSGNRVEFVPQHMLRSGFTLAYKRFFINYNYSYLSEQFTDATNATKTANAVMGIIPAYWVADLGLGCKGKHIGAELHVNNVTNNFYFTRRASGYPGPGIIPAEIRNGYLTVSYSF